MEGLEPVRKRPGMYIGSTGPRGLHHLVGSRLERLASCFFWPREMLTCHLLQVYEVVDNAIDEAQAGHATLVELELRADGAVAVRDNGRGVRRGQEGKSLHPSGPY